MASYQLNNNELNSVSKESELQEEHQQVQALLKSIYQNKPEQNIEQLVSQIKILEEFSFNRNRTYMIWDQVNFKPIYISKNSIAYGYSPEDIYQMSLLTMMKRVYWKQVTSILRLVKIRSHPFIKKINLLPKEKREDFYCGIKLKDKWGKIHTFFTREKFIKVSETGLAQLTFVQAENISHLIKKDIIWLRSIGYHNNHQLARTFFLHPNKKNSNDLLSDRELEVLKLSVQTNNINKISQTLNISSETVKAHRKNMLAKSGAKDMSALIYLSKLCKII